MFIDVIGANKEIDMKVLELSKTDPLGNELKTIDTKLWFKLCCLLHLKLLFFALDFNSQGLGLQKLVDGINKNESRRRALILFFLHKRKGEKKKIIFALLGSL